MAEVIHQMLEETKRWGSKAPVVRGRIRAKLDELLRYAKGEQAVMGERDLKALMFLVEQPLKIHPTLRLLATAAAGRQALNEGRPLTPSQAAALGSVGEARVRQHVLAGVLVRTDDGLITNASARRWLGGV
ncbi:MAG: hypothetical protein ACTHU0_21590 [Kofleriaceae bacterium]